MQKRKQAAGDPTMKRWNAAIRLANYASAESSLCVRLDTPVQFLCLIRETIDLVPWRSARLPCEGASGGRLG
jgi:hypothetical protein